MDKSKIAKEIFMNLLESKIPLKGSFPYGKYSVEYQIAEGEKDPISLAICLLNEENEIETSHFAFQDELKLICAAYYQNNYFESPQFNVTIYLSDESVLSDKRIKDLDLKSFVVFCTQMEVEASIVAKQLSEIIKSVEYFCLEKKGKWPL
jgi:hypothetical protein